MKKKLTILFVTVFALVAFSFTANGSSSNKQKENDTLKKEVNELKITVAELNLRLSKLEAKISELTSKPKKKSGSFQAN